MLQQQVQSPRLVTVQGQMQPLQQNNADWRGGRG